MTTRTKIVPPPSEVLEQIVKDKEFPRGYYARSLLDGTQCLSGSDLKGKASDYAGSYASIRNRVLAVCKKYGVTDGYDADHKGRRVLTMMEREEA